MSCVRYFNGTPHIVRFGSLDDKNGRTWVLFWRNGVRFEITVEGDDVLGTRFERQWRELSRESDNHPDGRKDWVHQWEMLCDCVISQCLDVLEEMAPDGLRFWTTIRDYVHTPGFDLKVVADQGVGDAVGRVIAGPKVDGAYGLTPASVEKLGVVFDGLERFGSENLKVLDREVSWTAAPNRVESGDGRLFTFFGVEQDAECSETGKINNHSIDRIRALLKIRKQCQDHPAGAINRIAQVCGYVTDETDPSEDRRRWGPVVDKEEDAAKPATSESETLIAGILLTDFPHFRTLGHLVRDAEEDSTLLESIKANKDAWRSQTLTIVGDLHARGMACGLANDRGTWLWINQHTIRIDEDELVWFDPLVKCFMPVNGEAASSVESERDFEEKKAMDLEGIARVYEEWLPEQLSKLETTASAL